MQRMREFWNAFRNFAIIFSFIMNFVLVIVLIFVVYLIFDIKNGIAEPLIDGLHANFVGLDEAVIETQIPVDDTIPVKFDLQLNQSTTVRLNQPAVINNVPAVFQITGGGGTITGTVDITLPQDTPLDITLDLTVPVDQQIDINLDVPVNIPLKDTTLSEPFTNLRALFEPFVRMLDNLPSGWGDVRQFTLDTLNGETDLLAETDGSRNPWPIENPGGVFIEPREAELAQPSLQSTPPPSTNGVETQTVPSFATPTITPFPTSTPAQ